MGTILPQARAVVRRDRGFGRRGRSWGRAGWFLPRRGKSAWRRSCRSRSRHRSARCRSRRSDRRPCGRSFSRPRATGSPLSAAKPMSSGRARSRRAVPSSARMSFVPHQAQLQGRIALFNLLGRAPAGRRVVGDRRGHDHHLSAGRRRVHGLVHFLRASHPHHFDASRHVERRGSGNEHDSRSPARGFRRNLVAHAAARPVADVADGIDVFVGRPGGDDDQLAEQCARRRENAPRRLRRSPAARRAGPCRSSRTRDSPAPGSTNRTPRAASVAMLRRTASCSSMFVFMAGAISTGARVAR